MTYLTYAAARLFAGTESTGLRSGCPSGAKTRSTKLKTGVGVEGRFGLISLPYPAIPLICIICVICGCLISVLRALWIGRGRRGSLCPPCEPFRRARRVTKNPLRTDGIQG
jgi:hypothetical protein